jgi:hypothetical protein
MAGQLRQILRTAAEASAQLARGGAGALEAFGCGPPMRATRGGDGGESAAALRPGTSNKVEYHTDPLRARQPGVEDKNAA